MNDFVEWLKQHIILVVAMVLIAAAFLVKKQQQSATSTTGNPADLSGLSTDANGNKIVYRDVADTFINYSQVSGSYNSPVSTATTNNRITTTTNNKTTTTTTKTSEIENSPVTIRTTTPNPTQPTASAPAPVQSSPSAPVEHPIEQHPSQPIAQQTYTVVSGDTLSAIASRYNTDWQTLYNKNKNTIDTTSNQHGNPIPGGAWNNIFPGEVLNI